MEPIKIKMDLAIADIDFRVIGIGSSPNDPGDDRVEVLSKFLTEELAKAGGIANIEVNQERAFVEWIVPDNTGDGLQPSYVAHLLQSGLMKDPVANLAPTAYAGGLHMLTSNLLAFGSMGMNPYLAERDLRLLVMIAPFSVNALSVLGLILMDKGMVIEGAEYLVAACEVDPYDFFANKYAGIAFTSSDRPEEAVRHLLVCIQVLANIGESPDVHLRTAYGMALLAAGINAEAEMQFMLVCGKRVPNMTLERWVTDGYKLKSDILVGILKSEPEPVKQVDPTKTVKPVQKAKEKSKAKPKVKKTKKG